MIINMQQEPPLNRYHLLTQTVIPRPIAWVLSSNDASVRAESVEHLEKVDAVKSETIKSTLNLAPFSFFNAVCSDPPLIVLSIGKKPSGDAKDTRHNLLAGRECVIHIAHLSQAEAVNSSAATLVYGESEPVLADLALADFPGCSVPRISGCPIAYRCKLYESHEIGPAKQAIMYVEILDVYVDDAIITKTQTDDNHRYTIDPKGVNPLVRLGGTAYACVDGVFSLSRP